jgi:uncharacterized protein (DUF427 family)
MLTPGPDHPITIEPAQRRWRAAFNGHVIADTADALVLTEASYGPVVYFPRADVNTEYMGRTTRSTHCPYKGDASYYTLDMNGRIAENVAWTYESPFPAMTRIGGYLAFYTDRVEVYAVDDGVVNPHHAQPSPDDRAAVNQAILHTDDGGGRSQREPWEPTVGTPNDGGLR